MWQNILTVGQQALVLLLLVAVGFVCGKVGLIGPAALDGITNLTLYIVIPCTLISAFQLELTPDTLRDFLLGIAAALGCHLFNFWMNRLAIRDPSDKRKRVLVVSSTFSNCNFMGFPLQSALLGPSGVFYGSPYAMMTPLFFWTVGVSYLEGNTKSLQWKRIFLNPGVLGTAAGLTLFLSGLTLPNILNAAVDHLANLAVPVPMVIIGCQMAKTSLRRILKDGWCWLAAAMRLLLLPLAEIAVLYALGVRGNVLIATAVAASASPAAMVAMVAQQTGQEPELAAQLVSLQTLLAMFTMPVVVGLAQLLAG